MKHQLQKLIIQALEQLKRNDQLPKDLEADVQIDRTRDSGHGDYASNIALTLGKAAKTNPRELAARIVAALPADENVKKTEIAGPGFINFFLTPDASYTVIKSVHKEGGEFGRSDLGKNRRVLVEFVSANPTGPLHVGHGRGAAFGAALSNLLAAAGFSVHREYYVNDAGRQMNILAASVWLRYLELCGEAVDFPSNGYKGDYVFDIAATVHRDHSEKFRCAPTMIFNGLPPDATPDGLGDKEAHIDGVIDRAQEILGNTGFRVMLDTALDAILDDIKRDLTEFGVEYDEWFSERSLAKSGAVLDAVTSLRNAGHTYDKGGNLWFASSKFGDEKDRVLVRENGVPTYFAADIAYHLNKIRRGYDQIIDIWGADHHGYVARLKASLQALNFDPSTLEILLVQFAILYRGAERVQMSTRSGQFVTLRQLRGEVGKDAARFFYVMRKCEQHMDFDLELAKSESSDNPVYYIQYAHARVCSVLRQLNEKSLNYDQRQGLDNLASLTEQHELDIITSLSKYPEIVESGARNHEPHQIAHYLRDLANDFHTYYNAHQFIVENDALRNARLSLILAVRQVIRNGLTILGVSAPESM
ncbi:MAG: arginine--tRNA ligase [Gammaproteobacteria bacterium]|nr:arginine--tRNA ligase [Gammaproteobacteria bacterium]